MKYDFTTQTDRKAAGALKWRSVKEPGIVPLSVADMEFQPPEKLRKALAQCAEDMIFGYTGATDSYYAAVINWMKRRHGWDISKEEICLSAGVVPAIFTAVRAFTEPGEGVLVLTPVYNPFFMAIEKNGRRTVASELIAENGAYRIDFDDLASKAALPDVKLMIFCSPHNPIGRVWTPVELARVAEICLENGVKIICDEIHHDLIMPGYEHTVMAGLSGEIADITVTCTAPSKTFNLAGLCASNIIIKNGDMRKRYTEEAMKNFFPSVNCFGLAGCRAAYDECGDWLDECIEVIDGNRRLAEDFFARRLPEIKTYPLEGTYLLWADCRALGMDAASLETFMKEKAKLYLDEGYVFGEGGEGFERFNIACPRSVLEQSLERLYKAVKG